MDIIERIKSLYDGLSQTQKRIAEYLFSHADEACFLSLKAFAEHVNATEVTVVNFTHKVGLDSFVQLKKELQSYLRLRVSPYGKIKLASQAPQGLAVEVNDIIANEQTLVQHTLGNLEPETINCVLEMLENARKIFVVGYDSSLPVAQFWLLRLRYLGLDAEPLSFSDYSHMSLELSRANAQTLFLLISFPEHLDKMQAVAQLLRQNKRKMIALVNDLSAPIAACADLTLCCETTDVLFYNSITSAISLVNLISTLYASRHQESFMNIRTEVQQTEQQLAHLLADAKAEGV